MKQVFQKVMSLFFAFSLLSISCLSGLALSEHEQLLSWEGKISEALWTELNKAEDSDKLPVSLWYRDTAISCWSGAREAFIPCPTPVDGSC